MLPPRYRTKSQPNPSREISLTTRGIVGYRAGLDITSKGSQRVKVVAGPETACVTSSKKRPRLRLVATTVDAESPYTSRQNVKKEQDDTRFAEAIQQVDYQSDLESSTPPHFIFNLYQSHRLSRSLLVLSLESFEHEQSVPASSGLVASSTHTLSRKGIRQKKIVINRLSQSFGETNRKESPEAVY